MNIRQSLLALAVALPISALAQDSQPASLQPVVPMTISQASMPESVAFFYMRELQTVPASRVAEIREEVQQWRGFVHDRLRKVGNQWARPDAFKHKRDVFTKYMLEASQELKPTKTDGEKRSAPKTEAEKRSAAAKAGVKVMQAALAWEDPVMRDYLVALATLRAGNAQRAQTAAADCVKVAPFVPAFQELHGMTLLASDKPMEAVVALTNAARLRSDRETLALLKQSLDKVPGNEITDSRYKAGQAILTQMTSSSSSFASSSSVDLLKVTPPLPGKSASSYSLLGGNMGSLLPTPAFDRLTYRQGVGLPVTKNGLLVDAATLEGAVDIFVRIDSDTYVPAKVKKLSVSSKAKLPPLALVTVDGYEFTPVDLAKESAIEDGLRVGSFGLGLYVEMGVTPRGVRGRITIARDGSITMGSELQPGETTAPVLTNDDKLCGMLLGRTDISVDDGGPAKFLSIKDLQPLFDLLKKPGVSGSGISSSKTVTTRPAEGKTFTVVTIVPELFDR